MAPVDIPKPFVESPSVEVVGSNAQGELVVPEPAGGILGRPDQGRPDAAPLERPDDLQVGELRHAGQMPADLGVVGWRTHQEHVADRVTIQPGDQQQPAPGSLPSQAVNEEVSLCEGGHQGGKVGIGPSPNL